jgi:hypothetical protein
MKVQAVDSLDRQVAAPIFHNSFAALRLTAADLPHQLSPTFFPDLEALPCR